MMAMTQTTPEPMALAVVAGAAERALYLQGDCMQQSPLFIRKTLAWGVHLFTASGAVWGFLALLAVFHHEWKSAFLWMTLAMLVDGLDGLLARKFDVKTYANGLDGALLDNILDYLNYVIVPALFLIEADILPAPFRLAAILARSLPRSRPSS